MSNHILSVTLNHESYPNGDHYPFSLPLFNQTRQIRFEFPVTFFVGENGTGKSTLLEAVALACNIHIWRAQESSRYRYNPYEKQLCRHLTVEWANGGVPGSYFGSEIFNDFRRSLDNWAASDPGLLKYFGGKSLLEQSHGQSIMSFFRSRYRLKGLYLLDEPETALSPGTQMELLEILREYGKGGAAQFIIATHSPILLSLEHSAIFSFDRSPVGPIDYKETAHYQIYKRFFLER